ncbi:diaminopropionate ammonia-lyase [bacterium]|nr:diaminopropionate ammonia-lyase [bacterium]
MSRYLINEKPSKLVGYSLPNRQALDFHSQLPGYTQAPLFSNHELAERLEIADLLIKFESSRFGLPAFKVLGASFAVRQWIQKYVDSSLEQTAGLAGLKNAIAGRDLTLVSATDGNHGRGVAWIARQLGVGAIIFMPSGTVISRIEGIRSEGADVRVIEGSYDEAVSRAAQLQNENTILIQDTSWEGYEEIPRWIVEGYSTMMWEIHDQLQHHQLSRPTHIFVPIGVGSLAVAVVNHFNSMQYPDPPRIIGVEPISAACALHAMEEGQTSPLEVCGPTIMAGLNCGTIASIALDPLQRGMDALIAIEDDWAIKAMRLLYQHNFSTSESGASSLAGVLALLEDQTLAHLKQYLEINQDSVILTLMTEGITDPTAFTEIIHGGK